MSDMESTIYNDDCRNISIIADCVITDPPYRLTSGGNQADKASKHKIMNGCFNKELYNNDGQIVTCNITWDEIFDIVRHGIPKSGEAYVMANNRNLADAEYSSRRAGLKLHNILVWDKGTKTPNRWGMNQCEYCLYLYRGRARVWNDQGVSQIFRVPNTDKGHGHPTQKPVALMEAWLRLATEREQTVYDPFMGVASTGVGCVNLGRNFIGCELEKKWFDIAQSRIAEAKSGLQGILI